MLNKINLFLLLALLFPPPSFAQSLRKTTLETDAWRYEAFSGKSLNLSTSQLEFQKRLIQDFSDRFSYFKKEKAYSDTQAIEACNYECSTLLFDKLSRQQQQLFMKLSTFIAAGGAFNSRTLSSSYTKTLLDLTGDQSLRLEQLHQDSKEKMDEFDQSFLEDYKEKQSQCVKSIDESFTSSQKKRQLNLIGDPFDFAKEFQGVFEGARANASSVRKVSNGIGTTQIECSFATSSGVSFLPFCFSPNDLEVKPFYVALVELSANKKVSELLNLDEDTNQIIALRLRDIRYQLRDVVAIQQEYSPRSINEDQLRFKIKKQQSSEDTSLDQYEQLTVSDQHDKELSEFLKELTDSQRKRLLQLYYRWIAETGGGFGDTQEANFHPGWEKYLELDSEQMQAIKQAMNRLGEEIKELHQNRIRVQTLDPIKEYLDGLEVLTQKQRDLWKEKTSPFSDVPEKLLEQFR